MIALPPLDPLLHQPVRTQISAYLAGRGEASFAELKRALAATDGNLDAHLTKLIDAGYLASPQGSSGQWSATDCVLTDRHRPQRLCQLRRHPVGAVAEQVRSRCIAEGRRRTPIEHAASVGWQHANACRHQVFHGSMAFAGIFDGDMNTTKTAPYDEMTSADGAVRPHYAEFADWLEGQPAERLEQQARGSRSAFRRLGITFAVYGESGGHRAADSVRHHSAHPPRR